MRRNPGCLPSGKGSLVGSETGKHPTERGQRGTLEPPVGGGQLGAAGNRAAPNFPPLIDPNSHNKNALKLMGFLHGLHASVK